MDNLQAKEYITQGTVLQSQGKYEEALTFYDKAEGEDAMQIDLYLSKGLALASLDRLAEAKEQFEKALKLDRTSGIAYFHRGSVELLQGDIEAGLESYSKAVTNGYNDAQLYFNMGLIYEEKGELDTAIRNYSIAIGRDAFRPDIRLRKAQLLAMSEKIEEALQTLDELILTNPDAIEGYHAMFVTLMQMNQLETAEELLNKAMSLFPQDIEFAIHKSTLLIAQKKTDEAFALMQELEDSQAIDDVVRRKIHMERAQIYAAKEEIASATIELEKARELTANTGQFDTEATFLLTNCYLATEQFEKVLECSKKLIENPDTESYFINAARYYVPLSLKRLGRMDEAIPLYNEAIDEFRKQSLKTPGNLEAYMLRAMCLHDMEEYEKALDIVDYVISLQPDLAEPRLTRVAILEALGRHEDANKEKETINAMPSAEYKL